MDITVHPPNIIKQLLHNFVWQIPQNEKVLYFTIDDGPIPEMTYKTLEIFEQFNAKATFFCVGDNVRKYPQIYTDILSRGHTVGNHTYSHFNGWKTDNLQYLKDVYKANKLIESNLFRPPYGKMTNTQKKYLLKHKKIILWDVLSRDFDQKITPEECLHNVCTYAQNGSIIVFHDNIKAMQHQQYALPKALEHFAKLGYTFEAITHKEIEKIKRLKSFRKANRKLFDNFIKKVKY